MKDRAEYLAVTLARAAVRLMPRPVVHACGTLLGWTFHALDGVHRRVALANLSAAFPLRSSRERRAIARAAFGHFGRLLLDLLKFSTLRPAQMIDLVDIEGEERARQAYAQGRGVLFVTGHFGFWEIHAIVHALRVKPIAVLARALDNRELNDVLATIRGCTGNTIIYRRGAIRRVMRALAANQGVAMLIDQHVQGPDAAVVDFFNRPAATTTALAALARRTGAAVIPVFALPARGGRYRLIYEHAVDPPHADTADAARDFTQRCTDVLEMYVRRHPELWLWMHRRWRDEGATGEQVPGMFPRADRDLETDVQAHLLQPWAEDDGQEEREAGAMLDGNTSAVPRETQTRALPRPGRVVVVAPNWLGDAVMALPALADIRHAFPSATLVVAARVALAPLFATVPGVEDIVTLDGGGPITRLRRATADARVLARGRFDVAILLPNSFHSAWLTCRAQIPERWGYRTDGRSRWLTRAVTCPRGSCHQADYYRQLVRELGIGMNRLCLHLGVSEEARVRAHALLADHGHQAGETLIGIAPGAAYGHAKRWPPERVAELIVRLAGELRVTSVLVGSPADRSTAREIRQWLERMGSRPGIGSRTRCLDLVGRTDLPLLMGVMSQCQAFVSNDSGAMHLAAALDLPVTAVFGPTDPARTSPLPRATFSRLGSRATAEIDHTVISHPVWCRPCLLRECPIDHRCMMGVSAAMVFEAVRRQLEGEHLPAPGRRM